ncbi:RusA family crossover junction endodeoxyribonuclease [Gracilibacillus saliphilus]|uniref:RusA family crossover junction endodeoxyribonuclease n=1 Tax=Gracilibacillus saliphilus TaxID=543890 RepID=UPI0013D3EE56|nr:RusA family crossover junction endodeoxyribonuclease [Gracilibacillus saliphilus]
MKLVIPGRPVPAVRMTQKSMFKNKYAQRYLSYKRHVGLIARRDYKDKPTSEKVAVSLSIYLSGGNQGDIDNYFKSITDSLNKIVYEDDRQIAQADIRKIECEKDQERVEVDIKVLEGVK